MNVTIFAGKGGVGKSTSAMAYALNRSKKGEVLAIDYDGGHSLARVLLLSEKPEPNKIIETNIQNIYLKVLEPLKFKSISDTKEDKEKTRDYLTQFEKDQGLLPFCDMVTNFFGVPTDTDSVSKLASLIDAYHWATDNEVNDLIIDVEPTAGLERLLNSTEAITRSIKNLGKMNLGKLFAINTTWPDIGEFIKGPYISQSSENSKRLQKVTETIIRVNYHLVCTPEISPVEEMKDVKKTIESYKGNVVGYVINNIRGEAHEQAQIKTVEEMAGKNPVLKIKHDPRLSSLNQKPILEALSDIGNLF